MRLTPKQLKKYQDLYRERYGMEISEEEVYEQGLGTVVLTEFIFKPKDEANETGR
ncbi:MAG: hypothetical protein ACOYS2_02850 [Patescibacteria group bacterium]